MNGFTEITICLHCGYSRDVVGLQMNALKSLESKYTVFWNNRIDRHPDAYPSYSAMINDCIQSSPTELIISINDKCRPCPCEVEDIIELLENGYACATKYSEGFMGFTKELIRVIGFFDERYLGGGYEDDDFVLKLRLHNLAYFESEEAIYDNSYKSTLILKGGEGCKLSKPAFNKKWKITNNEIRRILPEQKYNYDLGESRPDIQASWKPWSYSKIGIMFKERILNNHGGESRTKWFLRDDYKTQFRKVTSI